MSYWKTMPLELNENKSQSIVDNSFLLTKINNELNNCPFKFQTTFYFENTITDILLNKCKQFFDNYYSFVEYSLDFFKYISYFNKCTIFEYSMNNEVIAYIFAYEKIFNINCKNIKAMEITFFCIKNSYRHIKLAPYLLNVLIKYCITNYNISIAFYSIITHINSPYFCKKTINHRPINIENLNKNNFLDSTFNNDIFKTFISLNNVNLSTDFSTINIKKLQKQYHTYIKLNFNIYDQTINLETLINEKNIFYNILLLEKKNIIGFFSFCKMKIHTSKSNYYNQGLLYTFFIKENNNFGHYIEIISQYYKNIFDVISFYDIFTITNCKSVKGIVSTKYYLFNYYTKKIKENETNLIFL